MQRLYLIAFFIIGQGLFATAQTSITADILVQTVSYKGDTVKNVNKLISIDKFGVTSIIPIGRTKDAEFGLRIEILKSNLLNDDVFIVGRAYYIKEGKQWKLIYNTEHSARPFKYLKSNGKKSDDDMLIAGESSGEYDFEVELWERYYLKK